MKKQLKKSLSLFLAVLMLMTCWVWVAPQKAEAGAPGGYDVTIDFNCIGEINGGRAHADIYYITNNGPGSVAGPITWELDKLESTTGTYSLTYSNVPGWPCQVYVHCGDQGMREFEIFKFRSMRTDAEKDGVARLASKNDDRITPIGKFIRKVRIDELPQLFNILRGDMSFIGPRPERPEIIQQYLEEMPEFVFRTKVKAGLAGYAQVYGKYNTTPYDKLKLDLIYIENYTVWLDIKLMLLTLKILFQPDSTEGIEENQITALKEIREEEKE